MLTKPARADHSRGWMVAAFDFCGALGPWPVVGSPIDFWAAGPSVMRGLYGPGWRVGVLFWRLNLQSDC